MIDLQESAQSLLENGPDHALNHLENGRHLLEDIQGLQRKGLYLLGNVLDHLEDDPNLPEDIRGHLTDTLDLLEDSSNLLEETDL